MGEQEWFTEHFEQQRPRLRAVAYRMLGSVSEADDAVQDAWIRASRANAADIDNLGAWLTTIVARVCLNSLRSRTRLKEEPLDAFVPELVVSGDIGRDPEEQALLADSVGTALLVVLETLSPAERLAFVLHDLFAVPFVDIAPMIERTPEAARQLASRARRRVRGQAPMPDPDIVRQREVVDAFFAAARDGDFDALVELLHPDVVFRANGLTTRPLVIQGAEIVAKNARMFGPDSPPYSHVLVNGAAGVIMVADGQLMSVTGFTIANGRIAAIDVLAGPEHMRGYDLSLLE